MPKGPTYPLNSKSVKAGQLQRIAASVGLPTTGTAAVTRQLIEGKLMEMEWEPKNAQVIIQDTSENSAISLIEDMRGLKTDTNFFLKTASGEQVIELQHKTT